MFANYSTNSGRQPSGSQSNVIIKVTGPLFLKDIPVSPLEAASKSYADGIFADLNALNLKTGVLSKERFPAFSGDVTSATGTGAFNLSFTGITAGTYTKLSISAKGRAVGVGSITNEDIPIFSWNKIISGKPATLEGYEIDDGVNRTGGVLVSNIKSNVTPVEDNHLITKAGVDLATANARAVAVGDVVRFTSTQAKPEYLRCNGGSVGKVDYAELYAVLGDSGNSVFLPGAGKPWQHQHQINTSGTGDILTWTTPGNLPATVSSTQLAVTKNKVYVIGGTTNTIYRGDINLDGTLTNWTTAGTLPGVITYGEIIVVKNKIHLLAGGNATIYTAPISVDGTIGAWVNSGSTPVAIQSAQAFLTNTHIYLLGGSVSGVTTETVYRAPVNETGDIGAWETVGITVTIPLTGTGTATIPEAGRGKKITITGKGANGTPSSRRYDVVSYSHTFPGPRVKNMSAGGFNDGDTPYLSIGMYNSSGTLIGSASRSDYNYSANPATAVGNFTVSTPTWAVDPSAYQDPATPETGSLSAVYRLGSETPGTVGANTVIGGQTFNGGNQTAAIQGKYSYIDSTPAGTPILINYSIPSGGSGSITYTTGIPLPVAVKHHSIACVGDKLYLLGGDPLTSTGDKVYSIKMDDTGFVGNWVSEPSLPSSVLTSTTITTKNAIYVLTSSNSPNNIMYYNLLDGAGNLTDWKTGSPVSFTNLNSQRGSYILIKDSLYYIGRGAGAAIYRATLTGGLTDYSPYYNGTVTPTDPTKFKLPDHTSKETASEYYFIKF